MRRLVFALMLPVACLSLQAEQTGRISGQILTKDVDFIRLRFNLKKIYRHCQA